MKNRKKFFILSYLQLQSFCVCGGDRSSDDPGST